MRVLLVHHEEDHYTRNKPIAEFSRMQFGISYISSVLKSEGHETRLVLPTRESIEVVDEHVRDFNPGLVCFTSVYSVFDFLARVASRIKKRDPEVFLLIGGPYPSLDPDRCLESHFDAVCVGEGEFPTLELAEQLSEGRSPGGIPNLYIKKGKAIERNEPRPFIEDLDALPYPDREMWLPWIANPLSRSSFLAGRGCPFKCTYCCNHALSRLAEGKYVRLRSPDSIVREIMAIKWILPLMQEAYLEVETLGANMDWALELCSSLERMNSMFEVPIRFGSNLRVTPNTDYQELFEAFSRANFEMINIGIESGSERIRREVLKRHYSNQDVISAVKNAQAHGINVGTYNLIGLPGETKADFRETVRINRVCQPDWYLLSVFFPYPGTALHERCRELGLLDGQLDHQLERRRPVLNLPGFSKRQVRRRVTWSPLLFYGGHKSLGELLKLVAFSKIFSSNKLIYLWRKFRNRFNRYREFE